MIEQREISLNCSILPLLHSKVDTHKGGNKKSYIEGQTIQLPKEKGYTMITITLHRKLKIEQHEAY